MELLAPAGSLDAFKAAVENGADAVYLGGRLFNARQSANNFTIEEISEVVSYAHLRGVKIYITVNVLIADSEIPQLIEYIHQLMTCGVDAIIIQDLGLLHICKSIFSQLPIHASTQMTIHNAYGARWFAKEGMERVVLARELSLDEIKHIARNTTAELETFVHGALCISYSGQCLFSSMIGGRSGNRGKCAQPCRMAYRLVNDKNADKSNKDMGEHILSPKDLSTIDLLTKLDEAGITSLKIEGRMKRPEYVATVVRVYRSAINRMFSGDNTTVLEQEKKDLAQIFNREFTTGYYLFNPGRNLMSYKRPNNRGTFLGRVVKYDVKAELVDIKLEDNLFSGDGIEVWVSKGGREGCITTDLKIAGKKVTEASKGAIVTVPYKGYAREGDRVFKTSDVKLQTHAKESYTSVSKRRVGLDVAVKIKAGETMQLWMRDEDDNAVQLSGTVASQKALKTPTTPDMVRQQLERLGNTPFVIKNWNIDIDSEIMLPVSEINAVRREVVDQLENIRLSKALRYDIDKSFSPGKALEKMKKELQNKPTKKSSKLSIAVSSFDCFKAALTGDPDIIYLGGEQFRKNTVLTKEEMAKAIAMTASKATEVVFALPRIWQSHETKYLSERIKVAADTGIRAFQVSNPAGIELVREIINNAQIYADFYFNIFNSYALEYLNCKGIQLATLSPELTLKQLQKIHGLNTSGECLVFGTIPVMLSEHCIIGSVCGGRTESSKCTMPCKNDNYYLQDRMKFKFPVLPDMACRMHIYNSKTLNMLPNIDEIYDLNPSALRLDLRTDDSTAVREVVKVFSKTVNELRAGRKPDLESMQKILENYYPQGFTKGHYFRGVMDMEA